VGGMVICVVLSKDHGLTGVVAIMHGSTYVCMSERVQLVFVDLGEIKFPKAFCPLQAYVM
jgi:hypothetical protein